MLKDRYWNTTNVYFLNTWRKNKTKKKPQSNKKNAEKLICSVNIWVIGFQTNKQTKKPNLFIPAESFFFFFLNIFLSRTYEKQDHTISKVPEDYFLK